MLESSRQHGPGSDPPRRGRAFSEPLEMDGDHKEHPGRKVYTSPPAVVSLLLLIFL